MKDVPEWMKPSHIWHDPIPVDKVKASCRTSSVSSWRKSIYANGDEKSQLEVKMCCLKCEEKVIKEIREVLGVFDVRAERFASKVVLVAAPQGLNEDEVLLKTTKVDKKAKFVELDVKEKPTIEEQINEEKEAKEKKMHEAAAAFPFV